MNDPLEFIPGYISPLTDKEHAIIGRIALIWGQIEHSVEHLVCIVSGLSWGELTAIRVADQPIGSKISFLKAAVHRLSDDGTKEAVVEFCKSIDDTKVERNHIFHGVWGWRADDKKKTVEPAARKTKNPEQPLLASKLPNLEKRLCRCARLGEDLVRKLWGFQEREKYIRYIHHGGKSDAPEWLQQWLERNPLDDAALDRSAKSGRLPRLEQLLPRK